MVAKVLGIPKTSLGNWVRLNAMGSLGWVQGDDKAAKVSAEQMDIARLRAENARLRMERDIAKEKPWRTSYKTRCKVRLDLPNEKAVPGKFVLRGAGGERERELQLAALT